MNSVLNCLFEIKSVNSAGIFAGKGSIYGEIDGDGEIIMPGAFGDSLKSWAEKGRMPAMLWQHDMRQPIGAYSSIKETPDGLEVEGQLAMRTQKGAEAYELMKMGALSGLSVGFMCLDDSYNAANGVRMINKADLWEISPVTFPANDNARITSVKSVDQIMDLKGIEKLLRDSGGFSRRDATVIVARIKKFAHGEPDANDIIAEIRRGYK